MPRTRHRRLFALAAATVAGGLLVSSATASAQGAARPAATSYGSVTDSCDGQCSDILPPGENGNETLADIVGYQLFGIRPPHNNDQLAPYNNIVSSYTGLTDAQIDSFYNNASLGVAASQVASVQTPETGVTIVRDKATGIPHIFGTTRAETEFGAGYAGAEDRLWVMDVLRHLGRAELSSFAGGAPANRGLEQNLWQEAPYAESDLAAQVTALANDGTQGAQLKADIDDYLAGVNAYIAASQSADDFPGEYDLTGQSLQPFTEDDMIAIAGVIGGLFGSGGGAEMQSALVKQAAEAEYGTSEGDAIWAALREQNDPEATTTVQGGQSFPYGEVSGENGLAMPDPGSVTPVDVVQNATGSAAAVKGSAKQSAAKASKAQKTPNTSKTPNTPKTTAAQVPADEQELRGIFNKGVLPGVDFPAPGQQHPGMSNALVVSGADSATGNPVAVFGPQTGYFAPQLLMLEEIEGPGISARGVSFAGLNFYVEIGRGPSYSWSATSGEQDEADTFALPLCEPNGSAPTTSSDFYEENGQCVAMDELEQQDSWSPTLADSTAAGSYDLVMYRTDYGLVDYRGTIGGKPYAFAVQRSTYMHEAESAIGFQMFNDPSIMSTAAGFEQAASNVAFAFNWFYVNDQHTAYFNSGLNPVRAAGTDPNLPMLADSADEWVGWNPATDTADYTPASQHPNTTDQPYYVSWNNKQATGYSAADGNFSYGPVQRADLLNTGIQQYLATGAKFTRSSLVQVMENAALTDLRGKEVLPLLLQVIASQPVTDSGEQADVSALTAWAQAGAQLLPTSAGAQTYQNAEAIQLMDAWWPLLVQGEFQPGMGTNLYAALVNDMQINESPSGGQEGSVAGTSTSSNEAQAHKGSSFQYGWWGYVSKDVRSVLGQSVQDPLPIQYCGGGNLASCRQMLLSTLSQAAAESAATVYPADSYCSAGNQWCADSIAQDPLGGIDDPVSVWQNRPTYQQVVEFPSGP
jgi:acyl-homoserine lactone acylase PvdQ